MSLGKDPGTVVFPDGAQFGPQSVEIDLDVYERPIWRLRQRQGSSRVPKGKIPVRSAYESFFEAFQQSPTNATEWLESSFRPVSYTHLTLPTKA